MSREINFQQYLFGYDEGHRVVRSSTPLTSTALQELLPLTDSPGGSASSSKSFLIRGLPLKSHPTYALMCTWPALHMGARPGTVWTHVILIPFADLARIGIIEQLPSFFRYPSQTIELSYYDKPVTIEPSVVFRSSRVAWSETQASQVIAGLYGITDEPYLHSFKGGRVGGDPKTSLKGGEETSLSLLTTVWEQQWPRLRRSFTFMVGDWAVNEYSSRRSTWPDLVLLPSVPSRVWNEVDSAWVNLLVDDLMERAKGTLLRQFLKRAGADTQDARAAMKPLVRLFISLRLLDKHWDTREYHEVLKILTRDLGGAKPNAWISKQVFDLNIWAQRPNFSLKTFLEAILAQKKLPETEEFWTTIVLPALDLDASTTVMVATGSAEEKRAQHNMFVRLVVDYAAASELIPLIQSERWQDITLTRRPSLAELGAYWDLLGSTKERVTWTINRLLAIKEQSFNWVTVMQHVVKAIPEGLPRRLVKRLDGDAFTGLLQVLAQEGSQILTRGWVNTLNIRPKDTAQWLETQLTQKLSPALLNWVLVATDEHLLSLEATAVIWGQVAPRLADYPAEFRGAYATECICSYLTARKEVGIHQVFEVYTECWEHLEKNRESHRQHRELDEHLPLPLHDWDDWDLCLRLEIYVVELAHEPRIREAALQGLSPSNATARLANLLRSK